MSQLQPILNEEGQEGRGADIRPSTASVSIKVDDDGRLADEYLQRRGGNTLYHRPAWDAVFHVYRLPVKRLAAMRDGQVVGLLPLVFQRRPSRRLHLVSIPWFDSCGILADDEAAQNHLSDAALELALAEGARTLQLRQDSDVADWDTKYPVRRDKVLMRLALEATPDELESRIRSKVKNQIRKSEKSGLKVETGGKELLQDFYNVYSLNMRDLGSPSHSCQFFHAVMDAFPNDALIHIVRLGSQPIGCGLTIANGESLEIPWASSLKRFNSYCVNHALYWHILRQACLDGYRSFCFGRSTRESGPYRFKRQWGAEEQPLSWYILPATDRTPELEEMRSKGYQIASHLWRYLPAPLARMIGPSLISKLS